MRVIDLRSDTVTLPTPEMRKAMAEAECGDDVFGEDPTVNRLEEMAAQLMGKEAALFTCSGTMSNLLAVLTHCKRGDEIILGDQSHAFLNEVGSASVLGGVSMRTIPNDRRGMMDPAAVEAAIRPPNIHFPTTGLICLENTHNRCGGAVLTPEDTRAIAEVAHRHGIPLHLDGARIFNAAVYLELPASELAKEADSVCFCLSKGLSAPVGSLLCGPREFVERARKWRKALGGGMRQVGVVAAAGIVALQTMIDRLAEDHATARRLASGLAKIPGIALDPGAVQTNIVIFELEGVSAQQFVQRLSARGVRAHHIGGRRIRMVTHRHIGMEEVEIALERVEGVMKELLGARAPTA